MPHQRRAFSYAREHAHPAIFMEMRLGKTLVAIRRALLYKPRRADAGLRALVVAPGSALSAWADDLGREGRDYVFLRGTAAQRRATLAEPHEWYLLNKEGWQSVPEVANRVRCEACAGRGSRVALGAAHTARRKCARCRGLGSVQSSRRWVTWDAVILDESTFVKNPKARVTRFFLEGFRDVPHRWALTGMPAPEGPLDLWTQLAWLDGEAFGAKSYWEWRARDFHPDARKWGWHLHRGVEEAVGEHVRRRAFVFSRAEVAPRFALQKVHETRRLDLPDRLRKCYRTAEREFVLELDGREIDKTIFAGARWQWLRQMCGGFVDHELVCPAKVRELVSLLSSELFGQSVVVWSCYNQEIGAAVKALRAAKIGAESLTGADTPEARRRTVERFSGGWISVLVAQQAAAKMGVDLSAADAAIYFSNWPSLEARAQSEDRIAHPQKHVPLLYVDLVVRDTVDEDVADLLREKRCRSDRVMRREVVERMKGRA